MASNKIVHTVQRKAEIMAAQPQRYSTLRRAAENLSRRNADQAVVELLNETLAACVRLLYEKDDDGWPSNVDAVMARILVPVPWGRAGFAKWGLRPGEANVLRAIMFDRQAQPGLFLYDRSRRSWFLNVADYPTLRAATVCLERWPVDMREFRAARAKLVAGS